MGEFPKLIIDSNKLENNARCMKDVLDKSGIHLTGVVKGANGNGSVIDSFVKGGLISLASSRLPQLKKIKEEYPDIYTLDLRIPMLSELEELVEWADCSLNSEMAVLEELEKLCSSKGIKHDVLLMCDLGDLREGFFNEEDLFEAAKYVEDCEHLYLKGIGTNLGCYGSIQPDTTNLTKLVTLSKNIEKIINRSLDWVSGGASTSLPLVLNNNMPDGINHLRIGNNLLLRDVEEYNDYTFDGLYGDAFIVEAEIIEIKEKPSYPIGTIAVDAFGNKPTYTDIGIRKRALLALGRQDVGEMTKLIPQQEGLKVIGGSSDHTIVDITENRDNLKIGDILSFEMEYENLLYLSSSEHVGKEER
ncbi:alanine/ornithine racemase family PLP-dependent enzyme [Aerococcus kribbianus]|uniref:Alanine/ornithine racemase family PLP-dependent enzyme n=1 Tax=Aerococcus kribbianus TaxID=2999064 RepID=A0A9X3FP49_9LACT|nr:MULTISPECIES: alanine/ornithine racemase family PLP-dependent enzyme [unclassified Aerococcus]MCZ0718108.1 alanine/ornithine racemase family PLP-dependent enzyme [Aerococcus sp. YH-aer221]MCZ0726323.1 alanine/ornithine racemase family PLP-dependent enzyme [Aerococcus sp. YH-aer222]